MTNTFSCASRTIAFTFVWFCLMLTEVVQAACPAQYSQNGFSLRSPGISFPQKTYVVGDQLALTAHVNNYSSINEQRGYAQFELIEQNNYYSHTSGQDAGWRDVYLKSGLEMTTTATIQVPASAAGKQLCARVQYYDQNRKPIGISLYGWFYVDVARQANASNPTTTPTAPTTPTTPPNPVAAPPSNSGGFKTGDNGFSYSTITSSLSTVDRGQSVTVSSQILSNKDTNGMNVIVKIMKKNDWSSSSMLTEKIFPNEVFKANVPRTFAYTFNVPNSAAETQFVAFASIANGNWTASMGASDANDVFNVRQGSSSNFAPQPTPVSPGAPSGYVMVPQLSDEFNQGSLDSTKWVNNFPSWTGHAPGIFRSENVSVGSGNLRLATQVNGSDYRMSAVHSKWMMKFGYYEIRARLSNSRASSGFWLIANDYDFKGQNLHAGSGKLGMSEIDIFEYSKEYNPTLIFQTLHMWRTQTDPANSSFDRVSGAWTTLNFVPGDSFNTYGFLWTPNEMVWTVNGIVTRKMPTVYKWKNKYDSSGNRTGGEVVGEGQAYDEVVNFGQQPLNVIFDMETQQNWMGLPTTNGDFLIDYIRVYAPPGIQPVCGIYGYVSTCN